VKLEKNQYISRICVKLLAVIALAAAAFLAYQSVTVSFFSSKNYNENIFQMSDTAVMHVAEFVIACLLTYVLNGILRQIPDRQEKVSYVVLAVASAWIIVSGCIFLWQHPYYPTGDQLYIITAAEAASQDSYPMMVSGGLIGMCPQNKGMVFLYEILYRLTGDKFYRVGAFIHIAYNLITLVAGFFFIKNKTKAVICRIIYCGLIMFCAPLILLLPYIYGDLGAICFTMVIFWALSEYEKNFHIRYIAAAAVAAMAALLMRMNTWVVLIAVFIGMAVLSIEKKKIQPIIAALCIILAAQSAVSAVSYMYEVRSGYKDVKGIPAILYIAMGMQETDGRPGVYNHYHQSVYVDNNLDSEAAAKEGMEDIRNSLEKFKNNPDYAKYFFMKKLRMQWTEPTFEAFYATNSVPEDVVAPLWINELYYGTPHDIVWKISNYYQSIMYLALLFMVISMLVKRLKNTDAGVGIIPLIAIVGGFLFSIIWESQCRYVLPYYVFIIMYAPMGLNQISEWIEAAYLVIKRHKKIEKQEDTAA
jgi:hypothetical protein